MARGAGIPDPTLILVRSGVRPVAVLPEHLTLDSQLPQVVRVHRGRLHRVRAANRELAKVKPHRDCLITLRPSQDLQKPTRLKLPHNSIRPVWQHPKLEIWVGFSLHFSLPRYS